MNERKQYHVILEGDVQGVGFRSWMVGQAKKLAVIGWVKNREDDTVEAIIQGNEADLQILLQLLKKGPDVAWVKHVTVTPQPVDTHFVTFEVVY